MIQIFNDINNVNVPVLSDGQVYIYVLENSPFGNIKIGRTHDMQQRLQSLSGSNSGGSKIVRCAVSDATYLYTLEAIMHEHFREQRIEKSEWFVGCTITFDMVVDYLQELFNRPDYEHCNNVRKQAYEMGIRTNKAI